VDLEQHVGVVATGEHIGRAAVHAAIAAVGGADIQSSMPSPSQSPRMATAMPVWSPAVAAFSP
jgi:hypothetical protein